MKHLSGEQEREGAQPKWPRDNPSAVTCNTLNRTSSRVNVHFRVNVPLLRMHGKEHTAFYLFVPSEIQEFLPYKGTWQKEPFLFHFRCKMLQSQMFQLLLVKTLHLYLFSSTQNNWREEGHMLPSYEAIPWKNNSSPFFFLFKQHLVKLWPWLKLQGWDNHICDYRFLKGTYF